MYRMRTTIWYMQNEVTQDLVHGLDAKTLTFINANAVFLFLETKSFIKINVANRVSSIGKLLAST